MQSVIQNPKRPARKKATAIIVVKIIKGVSSKTAIPTIKTRMAPIIPIIRIKVASFFTLLPTGFINALLLIVVRIEKYA